MRFFFLVYIFRLCRAVLYLRVRLLLAREGEFVTALDQFCHMFTSALRGRRVLSGIFFFSAKKKHFF